MPDKEGAGKHSRRAVRVLLHFVADAYVFGLAKPVPSKGVQSEPTPQSRELYSFGKLESSHERLGHREGADGHSGTGGRHEHVVARHSVRYTLRARHFHRVLERPESETSAFHSLANARRTDSGRRAFVVRSLFSRNAHGVSRPYGIACVAGWW